MSQNDTQSPADDMSPEEIEAAAAANEADLKAQLEQLTQDLDQAQAALADSKDQALRALADAQNARRRAEEDIAKIRKFAVEGFAESLLPVLDSLNAALAVENATAEQLREGSEATLKQLVGALAKHQVEEVNPAPGDKFDPALQQAISAVPGSGQPAGSVVAVLQRGYQIAGRVRRPALVSVAQG
jgi:molecular chaperone GrpE